MNDLIVKINKSTRKVILEQIYIGNDHENLQEKLVFEFEDEFVDGQGRLEYEIDGDKNYIILQKEEETYTIPVQNVITIYQEETAGKIKFQLVVTEGTEQENIPVFKSNIFFLKCRPSINAVTEAPEGYELWIEQANAKLNAMDEALTEVDNLDIDANKVGKVTSIIITKKDGTTESVEINDGVDGKDGENGKDAKINGMNELEIVAGENIEITQEGNKIIISATGVVPPTPTSDTQLITSDNKIFITSNNANFIVKESD